MIIIICLLLVNSIAFAAPGTLAVPGANSANPERVYREMQKTMADLAAAKTAVAEGGAAMIAGAVWAGELEPVWRGEWGGNFAVAELAALLELSQRDGKQLEISGNPAWDKIYERVGKIFARAVINTAEASGKFSDIDFDFMRNADMDGMIRHLDSLEQGSAFNNFEKFYLFASSIILEAEMYARRHGDRYAIDVSNVFRNEVYYPYQFSRNFQSLADKSYQAEMNDAYSIISGAAEIWRNYDNGEIDFAARRLRTYESYYLAIQHSQLESMAKEGDAKAAGILKRAPLLHPILLPSRGKPLQGRLQYFNLEPIIASAGLIASTSDGAAGGEAAELREHERELVAGFRHALTAHSGELIENGCWPGAKKKSSSLVIGIEVNGYVPTEQAGPMQAVVQAVERFVSRLTLRSGISNIRVAIGNSHTLLGNIKAAQDELKDPDANIVALGSEATLSRQEFKDLNAFLAYIDGKDFDASTVLKMLTISLALASGRNVANDPEIDIKMVGDRIVRLRPIKPIDTNEMGGRCRRQVEELGSQA